MVLGLLRRGVVEPGRARAVLDATPVAIVVLDRAGLVSEWNRAAEELLGWPAEELLGRQVPESILGRRVDLPALLTRLDLSGGGEAALQLRCRHRQGRLLEVEARVASKAEHGRSIPGVVVVLVDVTERRRVERKLRYRAQHDSLTHLPNREALLARLADTLASTRSGGGRTGLLLIDLDRFKQVNDTFGHACGDHLLSQIGPRLLAGAVRVNDMVARLSGDEFAILLPGLDRVADATGIAARVHTMLCQPFQVEGTSLEIGASIGVAVAPEHGTETAELFRSADTAMYEAKDTAAGVTLYYPSANAQPIARSGLLGQLRQAIANGELVVHYQPKIDVGTERVCGSEALVRWQHPSRGLLPPADFIPIAESGGLMNPLTDYVLNAALAQAHIWAQNGTPLQVSVNLSARNLDDLTLPQRVQAMLARHGVPPDLLCLEITETTVMRDPDSALIVLGELSAAGIALSLDDYGTGYSSMSYLRRLPVTELKVDRSFIAGLGDREADDVLVRSTIDLGHQLNMRVVAEGVEDAATSAALRRLGCDVIQGYYYGRPMPSEDFDLWLAGRSRPALEEHAHSGTAVEES